MDHCLQTLLKYCLALLLVIQPSGYSQAEVLPVDYLNIVRHIESSLSLTEEEQAWLQQHPEIRIGIDTGFAPYTYISDQGEFTGLMADYLNIASAILNVDFVVQPSLSWSQVLDAARNKELDLVATATRTPERLQYLTFTSFYIATPLVIMSRAEDQHLFQSPADLIDKKVALVKDYASSNKVRQQYPDIQAIETLTPLEGLQSLASGEAQAYVGVIGVNNYLARKHGLTNLTVASRFDLQPSGQRFAVRRDWPLLRDILDKVFNLMTLQDINQIHDHWMSQNNSRTLPDNKNLLLTPQEQAWRKQHPVATMCVDPDWMPYEKIDEKGQHIGIAADYMQMFARSIQMQLKLVPTTSWTQSEEFARSGKCDLLSFLNYSEKRSQFMNFTDPYVEAPVVLVSRQEVTYLDGLKSLAGETIAMVKGYVYEDIIREQYPSIRIVFVDTMDDGLKQVSAGKIYATIGSLYIITSQIQKLGLTNLKIAGHTSITNQFRIGVNKQKPELLSLFQKAVQARDPQQENDILRRWISVRLEKSVDYTLVWRVLAVMGALLLLLLYRNNLINRYNHQLEEKNKELERLSRTDALTGASNRVQIDEILAYEIQRAERSGHYFSVIVLDIDHFKQINDTWGHQIGDRVLIRISQLVRQQIRKSDTFGRWGGEEFLIICPETQGYQALTLAEKLRQALEQSISEQPDQVTASFGVSEYRTNDEAKDIIARADTAMYKAKARGRNRACLWSDSESSPAPDQSAPFQISLPQSDKS